MLGKLKKNNEGFTIIEVLIVLAIAGLIMLIVFLAVPALQRNNRNTQRNNDAARIAGAVNECVGNNNGNLSLCTNTDAAELNNYIDRNENQQLITQEAAGTVDSFAINTAAECNGNASEGGAARSFTVTYQVETDGDDVDRCVGS